VGILNQERKKRTNPGRIPFFLTFWADSIMKCNTLDSERSRIPNRASEREAASPQEPGKEPRLVVMWRELVDDKVEILCRFHCPGTLPMEWGRAFMCYTQS